MLFSERSLRGLSSLLQVLKAAPIALAAIARAGVGPLGAGAHRGGGSVAAIAAGELVWWNAASSLNAEAPGYYAVLERPRGEDAAILGLLAREIEARRKEGERPRVEVVGVAGSWQNLAMTLGLEATNGYNPLRIGSYDRLVSPGETTHIVDQRMFPFSFDGYDCPLARELGLEYLVLGQPIEGSRTWRAGRWRMSCSQGRGCGSTGSAIRSPASSSSPASQWRTPTPR